LACKRTVNYLGMDVILLISNTKLHGGMLILFSFFFLFLTPCEKTTQPSNMLLVFRTKLKLPELRVVNNNSNVVHLTQWFQCVVAMWLINGIVSTSSSEEYFPFKRCRADRVQYPTLHMELIPRAGNIARQLYTHTTTAVLNHARIWRDLS
jgi:hypothetical protein